MGSVDAFYWRGNGSGGVALSPAVPILVDAVNGAQRVEDVAATGSSSNRRIVVGGGTDSDIATGSWIKLASQTGLESFAEPVSGAPTYAIFADPYLWVGNQSSTFQYLARYPVA